MLFGKRGNKKGVEWEIGKLLIAVVVLVIMIIGIIILLRGKGGSLLDSLRNLMHFGR